MNDARLEQLIEICKRATPGPWDWQDGCSWLRLGTPGNDGDVILPSSHRYDGFPTLSVKPTDMEFIVEARTAMLALIVTLQQTREENVELRAEVARVQHDLACARVGS